MPDVSFFAAERIAAYVAQTPEWKERPFALVPDMVVEVVSPNDHYSEIDEKVDVYLADGVRLIWVIDPQRRKATVHTPDSDQPLHLKGDAVLNGGDVIPGFEVLLPKLFE
ncbi:MAG: Uma2 family endonuclease [Chitinophagaceae bacterium]|nr:Uma2 family endonuclease [Anaerolineae bacterium]